MPVRPNSLSARVSFPLIFLGAELLVQTLRHKQLSEQDHTFVVSEAKGPDQRLASHIPQAIYEMYMCAKHLE
jgi:hypothetical protein